jgi:hypothetical protein
MRVVAGSWQKLVLPVYAVLLLHAASAWEEIGWTGGMG